VRPRLAIVALLIAAAFAAAGCGSSKKKASAATTPSTGVTVPTTPPPSTPTATTPAGPTKPKVNVPTGPPPKKLVIKDLKKGSGPPAKAGDALTVQYVGVNYKGGKQFDASWDRGQPFPFQLGAGQVIPGWDRGLVGMRAGGRRELIIPPRLGYGAQGQPPVIKPNETLVFVIDLVSIG
jgi:peptidylprolyl isomerase